jgi:hypothetical protein
MSTPAIATIFVALLLIGGFLLFGGFSSPAVETQGMPEGTVMENDDAPASPGEHTMPDGSMMVNETNTGTHVMQDGTIMMDSDVRMGAEPMLMDHSMMGHDM